VIGIHESARVNNVIVIIKVSIVIIFIATGAWFVSIQGSGRRCRRPRRRASALFLMSGLPLDTWIRFGVWLVIGLAVYFFYGTKHSQIAVAGKHPPRAYRA
jgi:amino acid transporter